MRGDAPGRRGAKANVPVGPPFTRILTGDELGLIRVADVPFGPNWEGASVVARWGTPDRSNAVVVMTVSAAGPGNIALLAVARPTGKVDLLSTETGAVVATLPPPPPASAATAASGGGHHSGVRAVPPPRVCAMAFVARPVGGAPSSSGSAAWAGALVTCASSGVVRVHAPSPDAAAGAAAGSLPSAWVEQRSFQACASVSAMAVDSTGRYIAVGGDACNVQVWDLDSSLPVWKAKGGKPNMVGLVDLVHVTALAFLLPAAVGKEDEEAGEGDEAAAAASNTRPAASGGEGAGEGAEGEVPRLRILAGTVKHKLWLYDTGVGKRPQLELAWGEARVTALAAQGPGRVWLANGSGTIEALDVGARSTGHGLRGPGGSIRALCAQAGGEPGAPSLLASAGLDRFVRVHDTSSRRSLLKLYMKQQLTGVMFAPVPDSVAAAAVAAARGGDAAGGAMAVAGVAEVRAEEEAEEDEEEAAAAAGGGDDGGGKKNKGGAAEGGGGGGKARKAGAGGGGAKDGPSNKKAKKAA
ncbi:hypothetical protein FOA52_015294 [Chlamydomonas sp. UWO 241]|nr:hypothetical protein FOA52_015294 [Chlamydomonas sp. UWO 241]